IDDFDVVHRVRTLSRAMHLHDIPEYVCGVIPAQQRVKLAAVRLVHFIVGIHPEDPLATSMTNALVPGSREIIAPREMKHSGPEFLGYACRVVLRSGVHHNHLTDVLSNAQKTWPNVARVIACNHAERGKNLATNQDQAATVGYFQFKRLLR